MRKGTLVVVAVVVLLVAVPIALEIGAGSGDDSESTVESFPTETPAATGTESGSADGGTGDAETTETGPSYAFVIDRIESCGETCRDVTTTLTSEGAASTDVTVYTRIYAGNGTDGDVVWEGSEPVGDLDAGESYTATKRVELSMTEAFAVQQADGWITVQTTIQSDEKTVTTTEQRKVT